MRKLLYLAAFCVISFPAFAAGGICPSGTYSIQKNSGTLTALGLSNGCFYVSKSTGSDTNAGTTEGSPWAHAPGMPSCSNTCASATISAGTGIIFRGGDSWAATDLGILWTYSGTSSHPNYLGVDPTWYNSGVCGGSWCRPIFNLAQTASSQGSYYIFLNNGSTAVWTTVDNIEEKGWSCTAMESGTMNSMISPDAEYENMYVHGWSYSQPNTSCQVYAFGANASDGTSQVANSYFHNNVVDGSDQSPAPYTGGTSITCSSTAGCVPVGCVLHADIFAYNVCNFVYNVNGLFDQIYGNLFENFVTGNSGDHCNMTNVQGIFIGSVGLAYNNIYTSDYCGGGLVLWLSGNTASASAVYYAFNNVIYNVTAGSNQLITTCTHPAQGTNCGIYYIFNNTCVGVSQQCAGNGETSPRGQVYLANNHLIGSSMTLCLSTGVYCFDEGNELTQTTAQADANSSPHFDQYTSSQTYAYSPVASTNSTVTAGQNVNSNISGWCSANNPLGETCPSTSFTGNLAAALSDTTYASENTSNHTVTLRSVNSRGTTWDIGAYQFAAGGASFSCTPATVPAHHSGNISLACAGISTSWTGSTSFTISGVTGASLVSSTNNSATSQTIVITTGSGTGTLTISDTTDSISTTVTVATATLSISPVTGNTGTAPSITLTGVNTLWASETASGLFSVSGGGCSGDSIATPSVSSNTAATAALTTGSAACTITITDNSTTATANFIISLGSAPFPWILSGTINQSGQVTLR